MKFDVIVGNPSIVAQEDGLYTIIFINEMTGEVITQKNLSRKQLEHHSLVNKATLAFLI